MKRPLTLRERLPVALLGFGASFVSIGLTVTYSNCAVSSDIRMAGYVVIFAAMMAAVVLCLRTWRTW